MKTFLTQYQKELYSISPEKADEICSRIRSQLDLTEEDDRELFEMLMDAAVNYASIRALWMTLDRKSKMEKDERRTSLHDTFIRRLDIFTRNLKKQGKDVSWREELGDLKKDPSYRKRIGDFACYMVLFFGLAAR